MGTTLDSLCTFHRDGHWCGLVEEDESVHVWPDQRMRHGAHVWRHDAKDAPRLEAWLADPVRHIPERSDEYRRGYQAGHQAARMAARRSARWDMPPESVPFYERRA